jgi:hypothetical protein
MLPLLSRPANPLGETKRGNGRRVIERNDAEGGEGRGRHHHHNDGRGLGGGVYLAGGPVCITNTRIKHNHADTRDDNVFGVFVTDCRGDRGRRHPLLTY